MRAAILALYTLITNVRGVDEADVPHRVGGPVARLAADPRREWIH